MPIASAARHPSQPCDISHPSDISQVGHSQPMQISLLPGQVHGLALVRATVVGVSTGELVLTRRIHLDADVLVVTTRLRAGAVFVAQDSEWAELTSLSTAKVWVRSALARLSLRQQLAHWWRFRVLSYPNWVFKGSNPEIFPNL